ETCWLLPAAALSTRTRVRFASWVRQYSEQEPCSSSRGWYSRRRSSSTFWRYGPPKAHHAGGRAAAEHGLYSGESARRLRPGSERAAVRSSRISIAHPSAGMQHEPEGCALAWLRFDPHLPIVALNDLPANGQANSGARVLSSCMQSLKERED